MRVANAPCSWGVLEFESTALAPFADQVLDEIAATGYAGTELGDWGFLGTDAAQLQLDLGRRHLALVGAFVAIPLTNRSAHGAGETAAVRTARLLADAARAEPPIIVLSDATAAAAERTAKAGRITAADRLPAAAWAIVASGAERIARAVHDATGLRTVFHHHCATYVETPEEIDALLERTDPDLVGLCIDTGHATYGGGDPVDLLSRYAGRVRHVHFKDCSASIANQARAGHWDYLQAVRRGLFCELGQGQVDFEAVLARLQTIDYNGWIVVEQDLLPSMITASTSGTPAASAQRNRQFLRRLGV
jgi:inosose dehydratase